MEQLTPWIVAPNSWSHQSAIYEGVCIAWKQFFPETFVALTNKAM